MKQDLTKLPDSELIDRYVKHQDESAFGEIFERYADIVFCFAYSRILDKTLSEEVCSDVFFTLIDALPTFKHRSTLKSFILGITLNRIRMDARKKFKRNEIAFDDSNMVLEELFNENQDIPQHVELRHKLVAVLDALTGTYQWILKERFIKGLSIQEISSNSLMSTNALRVLQHRALTKARKIAKELDHKDSKIV